MIRSNPNRTSSNNWNQHNNHLTKNSRENLARCISEPKLNRDKLGLTSSLDSLSGPSMPNILRDVLFRKLDTKTNILQSKWVKNWAVLQDNTLYIYADSRETDSVLDPLVLYGQQVTPENCKRKYAFQLSGSRCDVLLAAESSEKQRQWMTALGLASIGYQDIPGNVAVEKKQIRTGREQRPVARKDQAPGRDFLISRRSLSVENISRKLNPVPIKAPINFKDDSKESLAVTREIDLDPKPLRASTKSAGAEVDEAKFLNWVQENEWAKNLSESKNSVAKSEDEKSAKSVDETSRKSFYLETDF